MTVTNVARVMFLSAIVAGPAECISLQARGAIATGGTLLLTASTTLEYHVRGRPAAARRIAATLVIVPRPDRVALADGFIRWNEKEAWFDTGGRHIYKGGRGRVVGRKMTVDLG